MVSIGVVGSVNLDYIATAPRLPAPGETVTDAVLEVHPGGKGANQALAAQRCGGVTSLVARVGSDHEADRALVLLRSAGVDLSRSLRDRDHPTGVALITVSADGENQITVAPGANRHLEAGDVDVEGSDVVLAQLEIPLEAVAAAASTDAMFVLNAAPARHVPDDLLARCDVIVVNEHERSTLDGRLEALDALVVTTLGSRGAVAHRGGDLVAEAAAPVVHAIDTVGAGDAFTGALAVALGEDMPLRRALRFACGAGALTATKRGAQHAIPTRAEIDAFLEEL